MKDQHINTFQNGLQSDLGSTIPQDGSYTDAKNIRIVSGGREGESAIAATVDGNEKIKTIS